MAFTRAATVHEVPAGAGKQVTVAGKVLALFNVNGTFHVIDNTCTHRNAPLAEGDLEGTHVFCPFHGACFDLTTGAALSPPATRGVNVYKVQVVGDEVQVDV